MSSKKDPDDINDVIVYDGFFSGFSGFPPSIKINTSKFQLDSVEEEPLCGTTVNSYLFVYLFNIYRSRY
jgi:hypothetical protein